MDKHLGEIRDLVYKSRLVGTGEVLEIAVRRARLGKPPLMTPEGWNMAMQWIALAFVAAIAILR